MNTFTIVFFVVSVIVCGSQLVIARPNNRVKRVSDSHLADLETRIALNNRLKGISITMPVGGGHIDPNKIGRRRRSQTRFMDVLFNQSDEDNGDPIDLNDYEDLLYKYRLASLQQNQ